MTRRRETARDPSLRPIGAPVRPGTSRPRARPHPGADPAARDPTAQADRRHHPRRSGKLHPVAASRPQPHEGGRTMTTADRLRIEQWLDQVRARVSHALETRPPDTCPHEPYYAMLEAIQAFWLAAN